MDLTEDDTQEWIFHQLDEAPVLLFSIQTFDTLISEARDTPVAPAHMR